MGQEIICCVAAREKDEDGDPKSIAKKGDQGQVSGINDE